MKISWRGCLAAEYGFFSILALPDSYLEGKATLSQRKCPGQGLHADGPWNKPQASNYKDDQES